jgi:hypothetical protein
VRRIFLILAVLSLLLVGSFTGHSHSVQAASSGCGAISYSYTETGYNAHFSGPLYFEAGESVYYYVVGTMPIAPTFTYIWITDLLGGGSADATQSGNTAAVAYTIPKSGTYNFRFDWLFYTSAPYDPHAVDVHIACGYQGPTIPAGFVLHTITCDVPVYNLPGGSPVGDNKITNGQTWFVNPLPVTAADGTSWTEIFVSGYTDGYIPTGCVN